MLLALGTTGRNQGEGKQAECVSEGLSLCHDNPQRKECHGLLKVF